MPGAPCGSHGMPCPLLVLAKLGPTRCLCCVEAVVGRGELLPKLEEVSRSCPRSRGAGSRLRPRARFVRLRVHAPKQEIASVGVEASIGIDGAVCQDPKDVTGAARGLVRSPVRAA